MTNDPCRVFEAQRASDVGCRDLAHAVAHHSLRLDTPGTPEGCQGHLNCKQDRLEDIDFAQARLRRLRGSEFREQ